MTVHIHIAHYCLSNHVDEIARQSIVIMGTSYLADPEKSPDGTKELYLSFVMLEAFLSVSAAEKR